MNQFKHKNKFVAVMALMLIGSMALFGAVTVDTASATHSNTTQLNETLNVTNDTQSVWVEATDTNNTDLHVNIEGVDSNGNYTLLHNVTFNSGANTTNSTQYDLTDSDRSTYEEIRITLEGEEVASTSYGTYLSVEGSGTLSTSSTWLTDTTWGQTNWHLGVFAVIVAGLVYAGGKDDY